MKPIIGILARSVLSEEKNLMYGMYEDIINAIIYSGGIPVCILPIKDNNEELLSLCDGIIFQGGDYFENYEKTYLEYVYEHDIPTLCICLGMQLMGTIFGANFYDVLNHKDKNKNYVHEVLIDKNSKLYSIIGEEIINVNSRHKTAIKDSNLSIVGVSNDGVIEAIEDKTRRFFIGVQWHPESMVYYDEISKRIFNYFINVCK